LVGDTCDNIEGFHGVGNKTALKLLESRKKLSEFLSKNEGFVKYQYNRELVEFEKVDIGQVEIKPGEANWDTLIDRFRDLGFWSMVNDTAWPKYVKTFVGVENG
jgi:5'-3' exonuclease